MSRIAGPYHIYRRPDTKRYQITIYPVSGLPIEVCAKWVSKSFVNLPVELAQYREPRTKAAAQAGATMLIDYLKRQLSPATALPIVETIAVNSGKLSGRGFVEYLLDFWRADGVYARKKARVDGEALSQAYLKTNRHDIETHVKTYPGFRVLPMNALTAGLVEDWKLWAIETRGLSGRRVNTIISAMRVPIRYAVRRQELTVDPFASVDRVREQLRERGVLAQAEVEALTRAPIQSDRDRLAVLLAALCGMRRGEVRGLRWEDIGDGVIKIQHNWITHEGDKQPKRGSMRTVPIPRAVAEALGKLESDKGFVFPGMGDTPVGATWFKGVFRRSMSAIGIDATQIKARHLTYHGLRHTYITLGRMAGISDLEIQALAGHKSGRMMERYSHVPQVIDFDKAREKLERALMSG
ncbi:MAG: site-specific integrase [Treponema sp.]|jgi:integrase|nr:site-specific integrase [Treponema sp.]